MAVRTDYARPGFADKYARARAVSAEFRERWREGLAAAVPASEARAVLDVGAGNGRFWPILQDAWRPTSIVAIERSSEMLQRAERVDGVSQVRADLDALPIADSGVDVVFCSMALQYSPDPAETISEFVRVLRPGGWLVLRTGTRSTLSSFEFLSYFPTALAAERRAMPEDAEVQRWLSRPDVEIRGVTSLSMDPKPRRAALRDVALRGFPSLQLVPEAEFRWGVARYGLWCAANYLASGTRAGETSLLVVARRRGAS